MMESETLHSRPTLNEWTMFTRNGYSIFVMMTDSLSVVFGHFFSFRKTHFQKLGILFFVVKFNADHLCL